MIYAVKNNKVNRSLYKANEDALTSSIFERLMYLPKELMQLILEKALVEEVPGLDLFRIESIEYWPNWDSTDTSNSRNVEPDIFIRTASQDIIIEAKRYDDIQQQYRGQWENQIISYYNEYQDDQKPLVFIALGGFQNEAAEELLVRDNTHLINKCKWGGLLKSIKDIKHKMDVGNELTNSNIAINNILSDMILCFALFGFSTAEWPERFLIPIHLKKEGISYLSRLNQQTALWKN